MATKKVTPPTTRSSYTLSPAARTRLDAELRDLQTERAVRACEPIDLCGDIADIAEFAARDMLLEQLDLRISRIRDMLTEAESSHPTNAKKDPSDAVASAAMDTARPGVLVALRFGGATDVERFILGDLAERDDAVEVITLTSPLGRALLGSRAGDSVEYVAPRGTVQAAVVDIEPMTDALAS